MKLRGVILLVLDKVKGITLVFKNDPLEKINVNSTFDNVPSIQRFLQRLIEGQIRKLFSEDLPQVVHSLSLLYIQQNQPTQTFSAISPPTPGFMEPSNAPFFFQNPETVLSLKTKQSMVGSTASMRAAARQADRDAHLLARSHHSKWVGNNPLHDPFFSNRDVDSGILLCRSLEPNQTSNGMVGLQILLNEDQSETLISRTNTLSEAMLRKLKELQKASNVGLGIIHNSQIQYDPSDPPSPNRDQANISRATDRMSRISESFNRMKQSEISFYLDEQASMVTMQTEPMLYESRMEESMMTEPEEQALPWYVDASQVVGEQTGPSLHLLSLQRANYTLSPDAFFIERVLIRTQPELTVMYRRIKEQIDHRNRKRRVKKYTLNVGSIVGSLRGGSSSSDILS